MDEYRGEVRNYQVRVVNRGAWLDAYPQELRDVGERLGPRAWVLAHNDRHMDAALWGAVLANRLPGSDLELLMLGDGDADYDRNRVLAWRGDDRLTI